MKTLILMILLIAAPALAETEMPSYLKGAKIVVRLANGTESTMAAEQFKVVPRKPHVLAPKPVVTPEAATCPPVVEAEEAKLNRISLYGGYGPSGFKTTLGTYSVTVDTDYALLYGLGYSRQISARWSLEAVGLSNKTGVLGAGYSF